jgi:hypothetical protein
MLEHLATRDILRIFTLLMQLSISIKIKVMFKTDAVIDLWVGINGGYITVDEYYEMLNLLN